MATPNIQVRLISDVPGLGKAGQSVALANLPSSAHDPSELPTYLAGFHPLGFRADEASPVILHDKTQDKFRQFDEDDTFRLVNVDGSDDSNVPEVDSKTALTQFNMSPKFVGSYVPFQTEAVSGPNFSPRAAAGKRCRRALQLDRENRIWGSGGLLSTNTSFASANRIALGAGFEWNGGASSDPIKDLHDMSERSAQEIDAGNGGYWMNKVTANTLVRHDLVKDQMRQFLGDNAPAAAASAINKSGRRNVDFEMPGVGMIHVVAAKVKNESTDALDPLLANGVVVATVAPPGVPTDGEEIATTYTFRFRGPSGTGFEVREIQIQDRGPYGGTLVICSMFDIEVITSNICGAHLTGAVV